MERLQFDNGIRRIQVNDNGEYIELPMADASFPNRFYDFADKMIKRYQNAAEGKIDLMESTEQLLKLEELSRESMKDIDTLLGEGTCGKVFGNMVPDGYAIISFFEQLTPYVKKFGNERTQSIQSKYAPKNKPK